MFYQIADYFGVDTLSGATPSMLVPQSDFNLIVHDSGQNPRMDAPAGLRVLDITDSLRTGISKAAQSLYSSGVTSTVERATVLLTNAVIRVPGLLTANGEGNRKRLLAITSKVSKTYELTIAGAKLSVDVRSKRTYKLSFKYFWYTGEMPKGSSLPQDMGCPDLSDARKRVKELNLYFTPQANIEFELLAARKWNSNGWYAENPMFKFVTPTFGPKTAAKIYENGLDDGSPALDATANTITVFVVPTCVDGDGMAFYVTGHPGVWVGWLPRNELAGTYLPGVDWFTYSLGHELCHALATTDPWFHSKRDGTLLVDPQRGDRLFKKGMLINQEILNLITSIGSPALRGGRHG